MRREIHFPDAKKFSDLFEEWKWNVHHESEGYPPIKCDPKMTHSSTGVISDYCNAMRSALEDSLHVKPKPEVVDFINKNMFVSDYDSIYFEVIGRIDGVLVLVKNSKILGSRYLALLPSSSAFEEIKAGAGPRPEED
jgi:hypothetical protein